jgi:hypothetical protein
MSHFFAFASLSPASGFPVSSRSLRSAQSRKRVPSLPSASLGQKASQSFVVNRRFDLSLCCARPYPLIPICF